MNAETYWRILFGNRGVDTIVIEFDLNPRLSIFLSHLELT